MKAHAKYPLVFDPFLPEFYERNEGKEREKRKELHDVQKYIISNNKIWINQE